MIGKDQAGKRPVTSAEAAEVLERRKEEGELGYEQKLAYEHIRKFSSVKAEETRKIAKELQQYGIGEVTAAMITDVMPIEVTQLKHILAREKKNFEEDEISKMMAVVQSHRGK